jgi:hypothetical protein
MDATTQIKTETGRQRSLANLRPAKKGETRNPNGRPPRIQCVTSLLAELLNGEPEKVKAKWLKQTKGHPTGGMVVAMALFAKMGRGDLTAIKEGLDRVQGKSRESVDVTTNGQSLESKPVFIVADTATKAAAEAIINEAN